MQTNFLLIGSGISGFSYALKVAYLIVKSAQFRHESRGLHYTTEFPQHHSQAQNTIL